MSIRSARRTPKSLPFRRRQNMGVRQGRTILSIGSAALVGFLLVAAPGRFASVAAAERSLSDVQRDKIKGWIAQYGTDDSVNKMVTDILGLTRDNETISSRALAVKGSGSDNEIHQIDILPDAQRLSGGPPSSRSRRDLLGRQEFCSDLRGGRRARWQARCNVVPGSAGRAQQRIGMVGQVRRRALGGSPNAAPRHGLAVCRPGQSGALCRIAGGAGGTETILGLRRYRAPDPGIPALGPYRRMRCRLHTELWQGSRVGGCLAVVLDRLPEGHHLAALIVGCGFAEWTAHYAQLAKLKPVPVPAGVR